VAVTSSLLVIIPKSREAINVVKHNAMYLIHMTTFTRSHGKIVLLYNLKGDTNEGQGKTTLDEAAQWHGEHDNIMCVGAWDGDITNYYEVLEHLLLWQPLV
jgi:hypothetical protein